MCSPFKVALILSNKINSVNYLHNWNFEKH